MRDPGKGVSKARDYIKGKFKSDNEQRPFCFRCWKVEALCLCSVIPQLESAVRITLLQHPNERYMPVNTARFTHLGLTNSVMYHGIDFNQHQSFMNDLATFPCEKIGLLFPSQSARPLEEAPKDLQNLYVVDGTWNEAKKMIYNSQILHEVPHYVFTPQKESTYRIRKEPKKEFVSTVEAVVTSLRILEGDPQAYGELLHVFDVMVENQLHYIQNNPQQRHRDFVERRKARRLGFDEGNDLEIE